MLVLQAAFQTTDFLRRAFYRSVIGRNNALDFETLDPHIFQLGEDGEIYTRFFLTKSSEGSDWIALLLLVLAIHCISWWSRWLVWEPVARRRARCSLLTDGGAADTEKQIERFSQATNAAAFHVVSAVFAWRVLSQKKWFWKVDSWFDTLLVEPDFKFYYLMYAARYVSDAISLLYEHKRSDTFAYAIHHVVTVALVLLSAQTGFCRVGGVIMSFFDWADPPLLIAKSLVYLSKEPTDWYQTFADRLFEVFAVSFFLTRNVLFSILVGLIFSRDMRKSEYHSATVANLLRCMLLILVALMGYWLNLIIQTASKQKSNHGNVEEIRENDGPGEDCKQDYGVVRSNQYTKETVQPDARTDGLTIINTHLADWIRPKHLITSISRYSRQVKMKPNEFESLAKYSAVLCTIHAIH